MVDVDETYSSLWKEDDGYLRRRGKFYKSLRAERREQQAHAEGLARQADPEVDIIAKRVESLNLTQTSNIKHRHLNQLFIRGDSVVSISSCI